MISDIWDFIVEKLGEAWDDLVQLPANLWEILSGMFTNLREFSGAGLTFGLLGFAVIYMFRSKVFLAFESFPFAQRIFWTGVIYIGSLVMGYLIGKRVFDLE